MKASYETTSRAIQQTSCEKVFQNKKQNIVA